MLIYFLIFLIAVIYFELLGQCILSFFKKEKLPISFGVGFLFLMAFGYITTGIPIMLNCSFWYLFIVYLLFFIASIILIIKRRREVKYRLNLKAWLVMLLGVIILSYYAYYTSLGDLNGFDTTFYLNLITSNIKAKNLNFIYPGTGIYYGKNVVFHQYTFQSYYYFLSVFAYVINRIFFVFSIAISYTDIIIWVFQLIYNAMLVSLIIDACFTLTKDKHLFNISILFVMIFVFGKKYFNNVFGFYGNSLRTVAIGYFILYYIAYLKNKDDDSFKLSACCFLGACSFSSSASFMILFVVYASFFIMVDKDDAFFKKMALFSWLPLSNTAVAYNQNPINVIYVTLLLILVYLLNNYLIKIFRKKGIKTFILVSFCVSMFLLSYITSGKVFDYSAFFDNFSVHADMAFNYTTPFILGKDSVFIITMDLSLVYYLIRNRKDEYAKFILILIVSIFNPFCVSFINSINIVFYRAYDLFLNPYTYVFFASFFIKNLHTNYFVSAISISLILITIISEDLFLPNYYHDTFKVDENYNNIHKMTNDEYDILLFLDEDIKYKKIINPYIATHNLLTSSYIPDGIFLYNRCYEEWFLDTEPEKQVYAMFYPVIYYGDPRQPDYVDYKNMEKYIRESGIDYLVLDRELLYYSETTNEYYSLEYLVNDYYIPLYENKRYSVYYFGD